MANPIGVYDIDDLVRGDTFERRTFVMSGEDDQHISFAGWTPKAQIRISPLVDEVLLEFAVGIDVNGDPWIEATPTQTASLGSIKNAFWDLELTSTAGKKKTYLGGKVTIWPDVTRA